jgi:cysteine desulfurase / selenocysteine lyase
VAAQFGHAELGANVVIGQLEYSSNHFPWRQLARKGYDVNGIAVRLVDQLDGSGRECGSSSCL